MSKLSAENFDLKAYVKKVSLEDFAREFIHDVSWNNRLKTTGGRFFTSDCHLDFSPSIYEALDLSTFRKIVRHELVHYHLFIAGRGYRHRDYDFKKLLKEVDGLRFTPRIAKDKDYYFYLCKDCQKKYRRQRRVNTSKYVCGHCLGKLQELKEEVNE
ncbi:SprT family protein [Streptococcaceae bacterium ESL0729]|nr:SprT family protein [Streptococcaceae bacterium ESL0729]